MYTFFVGNRTDIISKLLCQIILSQHSTEVLRKGYVNLSSINTEFPNY